MKALILAAGRGNRMRPLTDATHKTLLRVGDRTIIDRLIDSLLAHAVHDITIVTGYHDRELREHLGKAYPTQSFSYVHNARWEETNNIYSLALAFDSMRLNDDIILIESDLIYDPALLGRVISSPYPNVALVDRFRTGMDGTVVRVDNGVVSNLIPPHLQGPDFDFSKMFKTLNIYKFSRDFCAKTFQPLLNYYAKTIDNNCYYESLLGVLIYMQRETIHAEIVTEKWAEVDDANDLSVAEFTFDAERQLGILDGSFGGFWNYGVTDFGFIANMYFPTGSMISEMRSNMVKLLKNYGSKQEILDQKLAYWLLVGKDRVHVLNGVSQVYPMLRQRFAGRKFLLPSPTFGEYARCFPSHETYSDRPGVDLTAIEKACDGVDGVVFVNPNNPTGTTIPTKAIFDLARRRPGLQVIVDESFIDFTTQPSIVTMLEREPLTNVLVLTSLSKSLGVPGVRLGHTYTRDPVLHRAIGEQIPIWNLNSFAEFLLEVLLKHRAEVAASFRQTMVDRAAFADALRKLEIVDEVHADGGNFVLVRLRLPASETHALVQALLARHLTYVKDVTARFGDVSHLRIAVRLPAENERFVQDLTSTASFLAGRPGREAVPVRERSS